MKAMLNEEMIAEPLEVVPSLNSTSIDELIQISWSKIAPFWPLKNLIAVNPISGFEDLTFDEALTKANAYFQQLEMPLPMQAVNRESIKWLQVFFDEGQSTISMPLKGTGLLKSTLSLIRFDKQIYQSNQKIKWLEQNVQEPDAIIEEALIDLEIEAPDWELFLTLMLTTLPGWASYIQYRANWANGRTFPAQRPVDQSEYLAFRLMLTRLIWPNAKTLIKWHKKALNNINQKNIYNAIVSAETSYQQALIAKINETRPPLNNARAGAQLVFCIDVRSEPFRRTIEAQGNYETYGYAGFFGLPVSISNPVTGESYSSCPVLLKPAYDIPEIPTCDAQSCKNSNDRLKAFKKLYQSLKYTFTTPFSLVEMIGAASGFWMAVRTLFPCVADRVQSGVNRMIAPDYSVIPNIDAIPIAQQIAFSANVLQMMGLTENFAPLVVFCGHGSSTVNNAFATSLDCGACGGRHGAPNARALAKILNSKAVRVGLSEHGIVIPDDTQFIAGEHNTTTDDVELYIEPTGVNTKNLQELKDALKAAKTENLLWRSRTMSAHMDTIGAQKTTALRAKDWAEVRPEWGLAGNACFIAAPRWLTKKVNLEGRSFLHSYDWEKDPEGTSLTSIMTAPVVVAQWINAQYLFSTLDNVAFGAGSKITGNITGKIGIMQGNASDLMNGLPLQSVFKSDTATYHTAMRLTVIVYAPKEKIDKVVAKQDILQKLFENGWIHLVCFDPQDQQKYRLKCDLTWTNII